MDDEPLYNIGVVARMTGVPSATIRAWERRYDFPAVARSEGGQRVYSEDQVRRLSWVKARVDEGMQASKAVRALAFVSEEQLLRPPATREPSGRTASSVATSLESSHKRLVAALAAHDMEGATGNVAEAMTVFPIEALILDVLRPALVEIGELWGEGRLSVATEHLASQFVRQQLQQWMSTAPPARTVSPIVLACAPGEWHDIGLLMLGLLLTRRGWPIAYLGQSVPLADLADFVAEERPSAVVLVAMRSETAAALEGWPAALPVAAATGYPVVLYGGRAFTEDAAWRARVSGTYLGNDIAVSVTTIEGALGAT